jgi:hypothetical protein
MSKRAKSKKRNYTSARERAEKQNSGFTSSYLKIPDGMQMFKPKAQTFLLDIMPYIAGEGNEFAQPGAIHWERTYYAHKRVGANGDAYLCPRRNANKKCPICEHRSKLQAKGDDEDEKLIQDLAPKQRQLFIVRNLKDPERGNQLFDISFHLFGKTLDTRIRNSDEEDEWDKFFFAEDGLTLRVGFGEKSFAGVTFYEAETIDFKPRKNQYEDDVIDEMPCLDDMLIVPSYEDLKAVFLESTPTKSKDDDEDEDEDDDDEDTKPAKKKKAPAKKKKPAPVEDDEDDEDEDDEEDLPPVKKKKSAPKDEDEDWDDFDEDDEDEDDDEEEEPAPKKKKAPAKKKSKPAPVEEDDEDDDDWDDEDEDEEPAPKPKKKPAKKPAKKKPAPVEDDEDDDDDDWDD